MSKDINMPRDSATLITDKRVVDPLILLNISTASALNLDIYWPVIGVTKPDHLWPFSQTSDYTDHGIIGEIDLNAGGTGNSFSTGLVLDGNGYATITNNADLANLGTTYSILVEATATADNSGLCNVNNYNSNTGWAWFMGGGYLNLRHYTPADETIQSSGTLTAGTNYQIIASHSAGKTYFFVNGAPFACASNVQADFVASLGNFVIGSLYDNGTTFMYSGKIKRVAVSKGTAWSLTDVQAIYAGLS